MNMDIYNKVKDTPKEARKPILAGRQKGKTNINPMWRIQKLTEVFGPCGIGWWYEIVDRWLETAPNGEIKCFVTINLFFEYEGKISRPIPGTGGNSFSSHEKSADYVSDECYKMALTDAISVACKALGMSADIYLAEGETKYSGENQPTKPDPRNNMIAQLDKMLNEYAQLRNGTKEQVLAALYNSKNAYVNPETPLNDLTLDQLQKAVSVMEKWLRKARENTNK